MVKMEGLTASYKRHPALHHVSGQFASGSLTAVIGPNGSGKSTLLKSILGLIPVTGGMSVSAKPSQIAYLPQSTDIDRSFPISVRDCVLLGCWSKQGAWGGINGGAMTRVDDAIKSVGLAGFEKRPLQSLSSGQLQRVLFARLVVQDAKLILLDEPFTAMDSKTTAAMLALIQQWHLEQRTVIAVLHDDAQVRTHFPQTLLLAREQIAWGPTEQAMSPVNLARARAMAEAWDEDAAVCAFDIANAALPSAFMHGRASHAQHAPKVVA